MQNNRREWPMHTELLFQGWIHELETEYHARYWAFCTGAGIKPHWENGYYYWLCNLAGTK